MSRSVSVQEDECTAKVRINPGRPGKRQRKKNRRLRLKRRAGGWRMRHERDALRKKRVRDRKRLHGFEQSPKQSRVLEVLRKAVRRACDTVVARIWTSVLF